LNGASKMKAGVVSRDAWRSRGSNANVNARWLIADERIDKRKLLCVIPYELSKSPV
jgi:hypothetical protein